MSELGANIHQVERWKKDSWESVEYYNRWFISFAPKAFLEARKGALNRVIEAFSNTEDLRSITIDNILGCPRILEVLRLVTAPPLAQDRLVGLSYSKKSFIKSLETGRIPRNFNTGESKDCLARVVSVINAMLDKDLFPWLSEVSITAQQRKRSAAIVADRLTGIQSDPIIRNEQESRQFKAIQKYLDEKGYKLIEEAASFQAMDKMTYAFHVNVPISLGEAKRVNMPIDVVIRSSHPSRYPLLVECKSAGDFANTNKRRKEEAAKMAQLKATYGEEMRLCLFLCGYFDAGYLGYEAAEGIDWVWEHRISDFEKLNI